MNVSILKDRVVLVTAGASPTGVGGGVVEAVAEAGGIVGINGRHRDKLDEAVKRVEDTGGRACGLMGDVSRVADCQRMIDELVERFGTVHHLVNNAGIGQIKPPHRVEEADFDKLFNVNVRGMFFMTRAWLRHRLDDQGKRRDDEPATVVQVSSVHGQRTIAGFSVYAAAKGAVEAMTRAMAVEYGPVGIRVNAVAPGLVHSEQNEAHLQSLSGDTSSWAQNVIDDYQSINEALSPLDVGRTVAFLLSPHAGGVTGQTLTVDHGGTLLLFARSFTQ